MLRLRARWIALALLAGGLVFGPGAAAHAADVERIAQYTVRLDVQADGRLKVAETIVYDFGAGERHGIERVIPVRFRYDDERDRVYPLEDVGVRADRGSSEVEQRTDGNNEVLRIGDPNRLVSGRVTYQIEYTVRGAINTFADHDELYWNAIGHEWRAPIEVAVVEVSAPAAITQRLCFAGYQGSTLSCEQSQPADGGATFGDSGLAPGEGVTVVTAMPKGTVGAPGPILVERFSLASAFRATPWTIAGAAVLAGLGGLGALLIGWFVGRDRRYAAQIPGLLPAPGQGAEEARVPLVGAPPVAVEFAPPDGVRPGQVGTLVDEVAHTLDVTATIVDFAVRGHLHIRELRGDYPDWELTRVTDRDAGFTRYERTLSDALFARRDTVRLSELKQTFADDLAQVQEHLYADVVTQGWFRRSPAATRTAARVLAALGLAAAAGVTVLLALFTHAALIGVGLVVAALVGLAVAGKAPARTAKGSAVLARVRGFELYLKTAEAAQIKFEERAAVFSRYLPYAVVFGIAEQWAERFAALGVESVSWYSGPLSYSFLYFPRSIGAFTTTASGVIASVPPSASGSSGFSGGGFSGGGGGGGGGGSW